MGHVRPLAADDLPYLPKGPLRPGTVEGEPDPLREGRLVDRVVVALERDYLDAALLQEPALVPLDHVLPPGGGGAVKVVGEKDFHRGCFLHLA